MVKVLPAILEKDFASVKRAWRRWEKITDWAQIDVVDGKFASNKTFNDIEKLSKIKSKLKIEVHLMVKEPRQQIADWVKIPAVKRVIFHLETTTDPMELIQLIHRAGRVFVLDNHLGFGETLVRVAPEDGLVRDDVVLAIEAGQR